MTESEMKSLLSFGASRGRSYGTVDRYRVDNLVYFLVYFLQLDFWYLKYSKSRKIKMSTRWIEGTLARVWKLSVLSIILFNQVSSLLLDFSEFYLKLSDDTLTSIAVQYSVSVQVLKRTNKMYLTCDSIEPGNYFNTG